MAVESLDQVNVSELCIVGKPAEIFLRSVNHKESWVRVV
jgi:hypothetical protein